MVKKMSESKERQFAFEGEGKESFRQRLESLIGERSVRSAALEWGLPPSTINNYIHKGTEPALKVVLAIAKAERVSLEWLACGLNKDEKAKNSSSVHEEDPLKFTWLMIYESLSRDEAEAIIRLIHKEGVKGILASATKEGSIDSTLLHLPQEEKERLLALHEAKKGASEGSQVDIAQSQVLEKKQAG